jgi:hypothetical protein
LDEIGTNVGPLNGVAAIRGAVIARLAAATASVAVPTAMVTPGTTSVQLGHSGRAGRWWRVRVVNAAVLDKVIAPVERLVTHVAAQDAPLSLLNLVDTEVGLEAAGDGEGLVTAVARVGLLASVRPRMGLQVGRLGKAMTANVAAKWPLATVHAAVHLQVAFPGEALTT